MKFYFCEVCGNLVEVKDSCCSTMMCCGEKMKECHLNENESEVGEKHLPVYKIEDNTIRIVVGSIMHPSTNTHYIEWIKLYTDKGSYKRKLKAGEDPVATFALNADEKPCCIVSKCNLHGFWKTEIK